MSVGAPKPAEKPFARSARGFVEFTGTAKLDRRTKRLVHRLGPDDVAVIDHDDIDRVSAEELLETGVRVVLNVGRSQTRRFPNPGPLLLVRGGVRLVELRGAPLFEELAEGDWVTVRGASVFRNGTRVGTGRVLEEDELAEALAEQRGRMARSLEDFAENTLRYLRDEVGLLAGGIDFPPLATRFRDRHALVVARGPGHKRDLRIVRPYIREFKPVLVGVDGGADALLEAGYRPDVIVGDMDSVSEEALRSGAEAVVHAYPDGAAPGAARLDELAVAYHVVPAPGISEDLALLLAYEKGAQLIVAVGTHFNLTEFLERDRAGMASTFVTRLKVGEILVDARGVSRLVSRRVGLWPLAALSVTGLGAVVSAIAADPGVRRVIIQLGERLRELVGLG
ncbi:MAG: putative cytokinetic ring protein SteA [Actinomycetota bacterium]|nr:putative cytokinetic ring protein SteA [Actinomycetota bacterium]